MLLNATIVILFEYLKISHALKNSFKNMIVRLKEHCMTSSKNKQNLDG